MLAFTVPPYAQQQRRRLGAIAAFSAFRPAGAAHRLAAPRLRRPLPRCSAGRPPQPFDITWPPRTRRRPRRRCDGPHYGIRQQPPPTPPARARGRALYIGWAPAGDDELATSAIRVFTPLALPAACSASLSATARCARATRRLSGLRSRIAAYLRCRDIADHFPH